MRKNITLSDTGTMFAIICLYCNNMLEDFKFLQMQIVCLDHRYNEPQTPDLFPILFIFFIY